MIASFSRALVEDLRVGMTEAEFDAALGAAIDQIYRASTVKAGARRSFRAVGSLCNGDPTGGKCSRSIASPAAPLPSA
jgi:hypothetical protein